MTELEQRTSIEWPLPPSNLSIAAGSVHAWAWDCVCSNTNLNHYITLLSPDETLRMQRFRFGRDRVRYAVSHAILRILVARYLHTQPSSISFDLNEFGKPVLAQTPELALTFNLSHTGHIGVLAIAVGLNVGVDIEEIRPVEQGTVVRYFSTREQACLAVLAGSEWLAGFYSCWTRKEAILKAQGLGLNVRLDAFDVSLSPNVKAEVLADRTQESFASKWYLTELRPALGIVGALATDRIPTQVDCHRFVS